MPGVLEMEEAGRMPALQNKESDASVAPVVVIERAASESGRYNCKPDSKNSIKD